MSAIILPGRFNKQPQYAAPLDKRHWLTKDVTVAITGATPGFNAATSHPLSITPGGAGYSRRLTPHGWSLYTPDGGWANLALGVDWQGPNTVFLVCRLNSVDNPWGGLFAKLSTGTSTQFAVGRESFNDVLYGAVEDSTATIISGTTISGMSGLSGFTVMVFTHSGAPSSAMSFYRNGVYIGNSTALGTQPSGTGDLVLGASRDQLAAYDSDADWIGFVRAKRVLSAGEIAEASRSLWSLWQAPQRRIWAYSSVTTINLTVAGASQANASSTTAVSQTHVLSVSSVTGTKTAGTASITQTHVLAGAASSQANAAATALVTQTHTLTAAAADQANEAANVEISVGAVVALIIDASTQANVAGTGAITQTHVLIYAPSVQDNIAAASAIVQEHMLAAASASQGNIVSVVSISLNGENNLTVAPATQGNIAGTGQVTRTQTLTVAGVTQANLAGVGVISDGIVVEAALTTGIVQADRIKKPGIPTGTADWLKTFLEIIVGRRGNKIAIPAAQDLTFSATPTQAECEALHAYTNEVREAVNKIITRLDS